jgi:hypothetical protein
LTSAELESGVGEILIDEARLQARVRELGVELSADYAGRELTLVGVLKGAVFFMADLMRALTVPCEIDFMAISSYGASTDSSASSGSSRTSTSTSRSDVLSSRTSSTRAAPVPDRTSVARPATCRSAPADEAGAAQATSTSTTSASRSRTGS